MVVTLVGLGFRGLVLVAVFWQGEVHQDVLGLVDFLEVLVRPDGYYGLAGFGHYTRELLEGLQAMFRASEVMPNCHHQNIIVRFRFKWKFQSIAKNPLLILVIRIAHHHTFLSNLLKSYIPKAKLPFLLMSSIYVPLPQPISNTKLPFGIFWINYVTFGWMGLLKV